ncbi:VHL beta domain-containing protein [Dongia deserti]|uniref:VHL beta domain-containing protein n=1 Tax=Dongia deserti TaxID=2268030 RepID=UPI000E65DBCC|nr:hypothetical protein [Dongia deserti]
MRRVVLAVILAALAGSAQAESELQDVGCAQERQLRSIDQVTATEVVFFNQSPVPIRTYWIDFHGRRIFGAEIRPGDSFFQQTYVNNPWVVTKTTAKICVGIFQPIAESSIVVVH